MASLNSEDREKVISQNETKTVKENISLLAKPKQL